MLYHYLDVNFFTAEQFFLARLLLLRNAFAETYLMLDYGNDFLNVNLELTCWIIRHLLRIISVEGFNDVQEKAGSLILALLRTANVFNRFCFASLLSELIFALEGMFDIWNFEQFHYYSGFILKFWLLYTTSFMCHLPLRISDVGLKFDHS